MRKTFLFFSIIMACIFFTSCNKSTKDNLKDSQPTFQYIANSYFVEKHTDEDIIWDFSDTIMAINDKDAYLQAYDGVCTYLAINALGEEGASRFHFQKLELLNSEGKDVFPEIDFPDRKQKEDSIWLRTKEVFDR